eukprot:TRINITY_DN7958_c0_g3_i1.p1 TRINITY_DN7958_c0_g3~~TRINITY_DN7958_c0_g3_i1.p1  ORF type:complete len:113 (-),score=14.85 TRINITY_DN7958_c0_g3_i1:260-598(-)
MPMAQYPGSTGPTTRSSLRKSPRVTQAQSSMAQMVIRISQGSGCCSTGPSSMMICGRVEALAAEARLNNESVERCDLGKIALLRHACFLLSLGLRNKNGAGCDVGYADGHAD